MAKIIEAKARISGEDTLSPVIDKVAKKLGQLAKGAQNSTAVDKMADALGKVKSQIATIEKFNASKIKFFGSRDELRKAQADLERHAKTMATLGAGANTKAAASEHARLSQAVDRAAKSFERQKSAVFGAKRDLASMGVSVDRAAEHQRRLASAVDRANRQLERQQRMRARIAGIPAAAGAIAGAVTAGRTAQFGRRALSSWGEFDIKTRFQRVVSDVSESDQAILTSQAKRIGQDTQFTNLDVVKAQTTAMQGLPTNITGRLKAEVAEGILENVKNYAQIMEADLATSAEAVRSFLAATGKDLSTKEKAIAEANKATNQLVRMAKLGGLTDDDVQAYIRRGIQSATAAGVSPEAAMAIAVLAKRGGLGGDESGVFMRSTAGKLVAPTKKGLTALNAAGIDYNKYVRMPGSLSVDKLESHFGNEIGTKFSPAVRARLAAALADPSLVGDRGRFTEAVTSIVADQFPKTKKGAISAADRQKIAKAAGGFHKVSAASVDAEGLLDAVMASNMTLAQLNAFLTDKHGGKGAITQRQRDEYIAARKAIKEAEKDPSFAKAKADEIMGGFGGALERLKGSVETLTQATGEATAETFRLKSVFDGVGTALDWIANLPKPVLGAGAAAAGAGAVVGATALAPWLLQKLTGGGFGLTASAAALDGSAAALTRAAIALGGGKLGDVTPGADGGKKSLLRSAWDKTKSGAGVAAGALATYAPGLIPGAAVLGGAVYAGYNLYDQSKPYAGMTMGERARLRRGGGSVNDVLRQQFNEDRERLGLPGLGSGTREPVQVEVRSQVTGEAKVTIDIPGLASRTVSVPLSRRTDNGPGSLGVSMPEAQPWQGGVGRR